MLNQHHLFNYSLLLLLLVLYSSTSTTTTSADESIRDNYYYSSSEESYNNNNTNHTHSSSSPFSSKSKPQNNQQSNLPVLNLATRAKIYANATCGENGEEIYCKLVEHVYLASRARASQCQVCDETSNRHPIRFAIDGSNRWWQSPSLQNGRQFEWVTITVDLKQVYQITYIILKSGPSPRPGNWILERSLDGIVYSPWQYFAVSDDECWNKYRVRAKKGGGEPTYADDEEVICTSYFSSLVPLEGGEIHTSLIKGRPGAQRGFISERLIKFSMARFVRFRLQKIRTLLGDLMNGAGGSGGSGSSNIIGSTRNTIDKSVMRRYFYSIKDISIGGHCVCFGHASQCVWDGNEEREKCECEHNTCGEQCDVCCPLYNQVPWGPGNFSSTSSFANTKCEKCECHDHADACVFDQLVASQKLSQNTQGEMEGGGVCLDCRAHTTGINCERCIDGYFRPTHISPRDPRPCLKCQCSEVGSENGTCVRDQQVAELLGVGKSPGDCLCRPGYTGKSCDRCAVGFRGYPACTPCPCHLPGLVNPDHDCARCICKENVEGDTCNKCKPGFYNLDGENPLGCTQCFCHGLTRECDGGRAFGVGRIIDPDNWLVTDLHGTKVISLSAGPSTSGYQIANEEFTSFPMYYWVNGRSFGGNRVLSYGLKMTFHVSWIHARGDTSGRPVRDYDLILQSTNNMLAFSNRIHEGNNATIVVTLNEWDCVVLPDIDNNIIQRTPTAASGPPCSRLDVMEGMDDVKRVLLRAKYHTDQIEGTLTYAILETADLNHSLLPLPLHPNENQNQLTSTARSVEICNCPAGYTGTSCQNCAYGYRRKHSSSSWMNVCVKCNCNGHSPTCSDDTVSAGGDGGKCLTCEHNTTGRDCGQCKDGYYGNPAATESPFACKPCECPLSIQSNNFSPICRISGNSYECTACPEGYEGPFCERCSNGYFGNPTQPGDYCKPCNCGDRESPSKNNNTTICDHLTGECLLCPRNTIGWNCEECLPGHYYEVVGEEMGGFQCRPCNCDPRGSNSNSQTCHPDTGQCPCKEGFAGRDCSLCGTGHGSPLEGCPSCSCNAIGSISPDTCDQISGQCKCRPGVGGRFCDRCLDFYFGFSSNGCLACNCSQHGSDSSNCDLNTGQCHCLPNVKGRKCDVCEPSHYNLKCGTGCIPCNCNGMGSLGPNCDAETGQCSCKPGVGGRKCDRCLDGCFGFGLEGCRACDACTTPGHVCDPNTGRCGCPLNAEGENCEKCTVGFWGSPRRGNGCRPCNCSTTGSTTPQCSPETGHCPCLLGFEGEKCDKCQFGYFGYPSCTPCACDVQGTDGRFCKDSKCSCSGDTGQCFCKSNVIGGKCDRCREGTFGLDFENPVGCSECFCFQRTKKCSQGKFQWRRLALPTSSHLSTTSTTRTDSPHHPPSQIHPINNLLTLPSLQTNEILLQQDITFPSPLYWQLPQAFLGDKILSYNGFLRFRTESTSRTGPFPSRVLNSYPLVQISRAPSLVLEHYSREIGIGDDALREVRLHESEWILKSGPYTSVTKEVMMVALQNLQHVLIRGTRGPDVVNATLFNVSLDIGVPTTFSSLPTKEIASGLEICDCPAEYNSTSCQNPRIGFYRWYKRDHVTSTVVIDLVGEARPCECNGRALDCDVESGVCRNCTGNTGGRHCDQCAVGFFGDPDDGSGCLPCPCPSIWNNHAESCYPLLPLSPTTSTTHHHCFCSEGYKGPTCNQCDTGYYGRPWEIEKGYCLPCNCNPHGTLPLSSISSSPSSTPTTTSNCDPLTGQCHCRPGVSGRDCSKCADRHMIIGKTCISCDDQCTGSLLNVIMNQVKRKLDQVDINKEAVKSIRTLANLDTQSREIMSQINNKIVAVGFLDDLPLHEGLAFGMKERVEEEVEETCQLQLVEAHKGRRRAERVRERIELLVVESRGFVRRLEGVEGRSRDEENELNFDEGFEKLFQNLKETTESLEDLKESAKDELEAVNESMEDVEERILEVSIYSKLNSRVKDLRDKLEDLMGYITMAEGDSDEAARIIILAREYLDTGRTNIDAMDTAIIDMELASVKTTTTLSDTGYALEELEMVFLMLQDLLQNFRMNSTKDLELTETRLYELIPLYRVLHAQPAFDHVKSLEQQANYIQSALITQHQVGSEAAIFSAVTAYQRMKTAFEQAMELAREAKEKVAGGGGESVAGKTTSLLSRTNTELLLKYSADLVQGALALSGIVENSIQNNATACKSITDSISWRVKVGKESLERIAGVWLKELEEALITDSFLDGIDDVADIVDEADEIAIELEEKIQRDLKQRVERVLGRVNGTDEDEGVAASTTAQRQLTQIKSHLLSRVETQSAELTSRKRNLEDKLKYLKALIKQARHKTNTVSVSLGPDDTGTCFRLYNLRPVASSTFVKFNFAPTRMSDSLLFYWPSSVNNDYLAIEMVSGQIKASWDLGSGVRTLIHPRKLTEVSENSAEDPVFWVQISLERIGSSVTLDVRPIIISPSNPHSYNNNSHSPSSTSTSITYTPTDEESTLLDLSPSTTTSSLLHIGGMSKETRENLVSNGLSGCLHNLQVNQESVGLWNFVGNEGCSPCLECPDINNNGGGATSSSEADYYFDGARDGYSLVNRIHSTTFNSKFFDVSLEFRTLSENGLIFLTMNDHVGQVISLELVEGRVVMQVWHGWGDRESSLRIVEEEEDFGNRTSGNNNHYWVSVRAVWVYQQGMQIGKLMIGKKDFSQEKKSTPLSLHLVDAAYQFGGVSPNFDPSKWKDQVDLNIVPFVGCMRNILINNSPYNPLSGDYFGVSLGCGGKTLHLASFEGNGYAEFPSQSLGKQAKFGFSFKSLSPTGLLVLSASSASTTTEESYIAVYLENGQIKAQIGTTQGPVDISTETTTATTTNRRYDDGKYHTFRFVKKNRKLILYMDDEEVGEGRLPKSVFVIAAGPTGRGLFLGGANALLQNKFRDSSVPVTRGFSGCIRNFHFDNHLLSFTFPISHKNLNLGQCPSHHEHEAGTVPSHFLYPNTMGMIPSKYEPVLRVVDDVCWSASRHEKNEIIELEDPSSALKFGDDNNSPGGGGYASINLDGAKQLKQRFNISLSFRTHYPSGLLFQAVQKKKSVGNCCLTTYLKDGQIIVKLHVERVSQDLVSSSTSLNDGQWHRISLVKAESKLYLHVDGKHVTQTQVPKIKKALARVHLGGIPEGQNTCLKIEGVNQNQPDPFRGCLRDLTINSHAINFEHSQTVVALNKVGPCFRNVESGTFFRGAGSHAVYANNLTLDKTLELQLEFKSDTRSGLILAFIPSKSFPSFSIFMENGLVIARETTTLNDFYEAVVELPSGESVCDGNWHTLRASYEKGSITLRIDDWDAVYAVAVAAAQRQGSRGGSDRAVWSSSSSGRGTMGELFIGGVGGGAENANRLFMKKNVQFHGCIRHISVNEERKDWTDMPSLVNLYLNSCPV